MRTLTSYRKLPTATQIALMHPKEGSFITRMTMNLLSIPLRPNKTPQDSQDTTKEARIEVDLYNL
jgi:hypothetical protein